MKKFIILKGLNNKLYGYTDKMHNSMPYFSKGRCFIDFLKYAKLPYTYCIAEKFQNNSSTVPLLLVNIISNNNFMFYLEYYLKKINNSIIKKLNPYIIIDALKDPIDIDENSIIKLLNKYSIAIDKVIILSCTIKTKSTKRLKLFSFPYFLFVKLYCCKDSEYYYNNIDIKQRIVNKYLCLNRELKDFRIYTLAYLEKNKLLDKGIYSLANFTYNNFNYMAPVIKPSYKNTILSSKINIPSLKNYIINNNVDYTNMLDEVSSNQELTQYDIEFSIRKYFEKSLFSIVTECDFTADYFFVTEKTTFRLLNKHPFLVISTPFFIKHLKFLGFKTFDSIIDHSYDEEIDNNKRLLKALKESKRLIKLSNTDWQNMYKSIEENLEHNLNLVLNCENNIFYRKVHKVFYSLLYREVT